MKLMYALSLFTLVVCNIKAERACCNQDSSDKGRVNIAIKSSSSHDYKKTRTKKIKKYRNKRRDGKARDSSHDASSDVTKFPDSRRNAGVGYDVAFDKNTFTM